VITAELNPREKKADNRYNGTCRDKTTLPLFLVLIRIDFTRLKFSTAIGAIFTTLRIV
jgi:hypothetical protein